MLRSCQLKTIRTKKKTLNADLMQQKTHKSDQKSLFLEQKQAARAQNQLSKASQNLWKSVFA